MRFVCPYGVRFQEDGRVETFPAAEISILGRGGRGLHAAFHIDSGATVSILPASDAAALGIRLSRGKRMIIRGIGDSFFNGYRHAVAFQFNGRSIKAPAVFVEHAAAPRILGRAGIFPRFVILFDEAKRRTGWLDGKERKAVDFIFR